MTLDTVLVGSLHHVMLQKCHDHKNRKTINMAQGAVQMMTNTCTATITDDGVSTKIVGMPKPWGMLLYSDKFNLSQGCEDHKTCKTTYKARGAVQ